MHVVFLEYGHIYSEMLCQSSETKGKQTSNLCLHLTVYCVQQCKISETVKIQIEKLCYTHIKKVILFSKTIRYSLSKAKGKCIDA